MATEREAGGGAPSTPPRGAPAGPAPPLVGDPHPGARSALPYALYGGLWLLAGLVASPWLGWRALTRPGFARMLAERLGRGLASVPAPGAAPTVGGAAARPRILVHGVSVGEVKGALPIVRGLEQAFPGSEVALSVTTDTGLELARRLFDGHARVRFPVDVALVVRRFLRAVRPALVVLFELELWPAFLRECNRAGIPVVVVNGRITERSATRYRRLERLLPQFERLSFTCAQSEEYAARFRRLGVAPERLVVTGNVKADGLRLGTREPGAELARLLGAPGRACLVAGSTHEPEELELLRAWRAHASDARLILVPRHPARAPELVGRLREEGQEPQLLSRLREGERPDPARAAIVDTIGELEGVYALADLVFVGGSLLPRGGQNMLEPAAQGKPVLFGPHVGNFAQEAALLLAEGGAQQVGGAQELGQALRVLLADAPRRETMGRAALRAVERQQGATRETLEALGRHVGACLGVPPQDGEA